MPLALPCTVREQPDPFASSKSASFRAQARHGTRLEKTNRPGGEQRDRAVGDDATAILCRLSRRAFPGCRVVVLCGNAKAEEADRPGSAADFRAAQLNAATLFVVAGLILVNGPDLLLEIEAIAVA